MWQVLMCLLLLLYASLTQGCGSDADRRPVVAVSFESQRSLVEDIAGEDFKVVTLLPQGSDPELFEPDMRTMRALDRARLYLTTSTLGFESATGARIKVNYPELEMRDVSEGIDILLHTHEIAGLSNNGGHDHDHAHDHGATDCHHGETDDAHQVGDPHILSSFRNTRIVAKNILEALVTLNPAKEREYRSRYDALERELARRDAYTDSILNEKGVKGEAFVVMHPSLSYYARDYDLIQIPLEVDGKEASPRQLEQRLRMAAATRPHAMFFEAGHNERQARQIADGLGIHAYPITLNNADFSDAILKITGQLAGTER